MQLLQQDMELDIVAVSYACETPEGELGEALTAIIPGGWGKGLITD